MTTSIAQNLAELNQRIRDYEKKYSRSTHSVTLLAASKGQSVEKIQAAYDAGQCIFGENYLQEALAKMKVLTNPSLEWHFIGSIQSNKTKKIAENFSWVHGVTHTHIAERLNAQRPLHLPPLNICLEVNISDEDNKFGVARDELEALARFCITLPRIKCRGLMAIPALKKDFASQRAELHKLRLLFDHFNQENFNFDTLSMGMSEDLEAAIAENATVVRIGTALFGKRQNTL